MMGIELWAGVDAPLLCVLDIVFVHEDIPAVEWAAEHDVKYFDGTTWCWWKTEAGLVIFRSMWRSYQGSVSLRNVYRKQACFRGCWHRAAVRLFAFAFDLWAGQWNKGRKPRTRPHRSADMQHHAALNSGLNPRSLPKNSHNLVFHDHFLSLFELFGFFLKTKIKIIDFISYLDYIFSYSSFIFYYIFLVI